METIVLSCPACGAVILKNMDGQASCEYCGGSFFVRKGVPEAVQAPLGEDVVFGVDIRELVERCGSSKILAIKELKERTGLDLKTAKDTVDMAYAKWPPPPVEPPARARGSGRRGSWGAVLLGAAALVLVLLLLLR